MSSNDYHFITRWQVTGTVEEVFAIISNAADLVRWWPAVYLAVQVAPATEAERDRPGEGEVITLYTKGWLPYTLRWQFRAVEIAAPQRIVLVAWGDFDGRGIWTFVQQGDAVAVTYDWRIKANKPLLRYLSFLLKPIFAANHHWAMQKGEESLRLELLRRRATTPAEQARIPAPPPPTTTSPLPLLLGIAAGMTAVSGLIYQLGRWMRPRPTKI